MIFYLPNLSVSMQHAFNTYRLGPGQGLGQILGGGETHPIQQWNMHQHQSKYCLTKHLRPFFFDKKKGNHQKKKIPSILFYLCYYYYFKLKIPIFDLPPKKIY